MYAPGKHKILMMEFQKRRRFNFFKKILDKYSLAELYSFWKLDWVAYVVVEKWVSLSLLGIKRE
jgi:hypothetical protein